MNRLASLARTVIVSVEYRLAPEHPLPTAYEDSWEALNWVGSLSDPWLASHGDLEALFVGGDSAGGNIVHNIIMRASNEKLHNDVKILGAFLSHPYFLDDKSSKELELAYKIWEFVYPDAPGGPDSPLINPVGAGGTGLCRVGCGRVLVIVAEKDELRDGNVRYYEAVKKSGFKGEIELFEVKGEGHCFHIFDPVSENAKLVFEKLVSFLRK